MYKLISLLILFLISTIRFVASIPASSLSKHRYISSVYLEIWLNCCIVNAVPEGEATLLYPNLLKAITSKYPSTMIANLFFFISLMCVP